MTINEKALEAATRAIMGGGSYADMAEAAITAYLSALGSEPVAWRPLEWKDTRGDGTLNAFTDFGLLYTASSTAWGTTRNFPNAHAAVSLDAAKAAAQADYEARIRSALTHPPATREGWVLVPVEPTEEMIVDGHKQIDWCRNDQNTHRPGHPSQKPDGVGSDCGEDIRDAWAAMLTAAPEAK